MSQHISNMSVTVTLITVKRECYDHCQQLYYKTLGQQFKLLKGSNDYHFTMVCKNCEMKVVTATRSKSLNKVTGENDNTFELYDHGLTQRHENFTGTVTCIPSVVPPKPPLKVLAHSVVLGIAVSEGSGTNSGKFYRRGMSVQSRQAMLQLEGYHNVTESDVKQINAMLKITPQEHIESYDLIEPYFVLSKQLNPTLSYDIEPKGGGVFERLTVVMPYTQAFLPNMLNVFGVDAGFMPKIKLKGKVNDLQFCLHTFNLVTF